MTLLLLYHKDNNKTKEREVSKMRKPYSTAANMNIMDRKTAAAVPFWRIADELGVCEETIKRRLRHQLPPDQEAEVLQAIERAAEKMRAERSTGI